MADHLPVLIFDVSAQFGHFKRIFATTTAMTYPVPTKTAVYGLVSAIIGLEKVDNVYLNAFPPGACLIGIGINSPVRTQRVTVNLRPAFGSNSAEPNKKNPLRNSGNRKPTLTEYLYRPSYRVYFTHADPSVFDQLKKQLKAGRSVYTPSLGLANMIAKIEFVGEAKATPITGEEPLYLEGILPKTRLKKLAVNERGGNRLMEVGQYAVEMDSSRDVTHRDDVILDRDGAPIAAVVSDAYSIVWKNESADVVLF